MDYNTFILTFPEFRDVVQEVVQAQLTRAAKMVSSSRYGAFTDDAVAYMTAAFLAASPFGGNTRLKTNDPTKTSYWLTFAEIRASVTPAAIVSMG